MEQNQTMYRIYGKTKSQKQFRAMDINKGYQVKKVIFATLLTETEANKAITGLPNLNPDWEFKVEKA